MFSIYDKLGGIDATLDVLDRRRGKRPGPHSLRAWKFNREIPAINAAELMAECQERGIPFDIDDFRLPKRIKSFPPSRGKGRSRP